MTIMTTSPISGSDSISCKSSRYSMWLVVVLAAVLTGCGSGSESSSVSGSDQGSVQVVLTDADDDFLTYQVNLTGITLVRSDGTEVDVLPSATEVDFVQYQELSELFTIASVPVGVYSSVLVELDYTEADIVVQDDGGVSYNASVVDSRGEAVTTLDVALILSGGDELSVRRGGLHGLTLDLDLSASNEVLSYTPAVVEVEPFLMVVAAQDDEREHRARGLLTDVDAEALEMTLDIRPMRQRNGYFGSQVVTLTDSTEYTLDAVEYTGSDGLTQLATLSEGTAIVTYGSLDSGTGTFTAEQVMAGSSVPWNGDDVVKGVVTARDGNVLTLQGAVLERDNHQAGFSDSLTVILADTTAVTARHLDETSIADISVGQRLSVAGSYRAEDSALDAADGSVRLKISQVSGTVVDLAPLTLDLASLNNRSVDVFDFSGTGESEAEDANPDAYTVQTGALDISNLNGSDWVSVRGFPTEFDAANGDFIALSVSEVSWTTSVASYVAHWFVDDDSGVTVGDNHLALDTRRATVKVRLRGVSREVSNLASVSTILPAEIGRYAIHRAGEGASIFSDFSDFLVALADAQAGTEPIGHLTARGKLDPDNETLTATMLVVRFGELNEPSGGYNNGGEQGSGHH